MARTDLKWLLGVMALVGGLGCGAEDVMNGEPVAEAEEQLDMSRFKGWQAVIPQGIFNSAPAVLNVDGNLNAVDIYGKGMDDAIWVARRTSTTAAWTGWNRIANGVEVTSKPSATMFGSNRAVVATRSDSNAWITVTEGGSTSFRSWVRIPDAEVAGGPAIAYLSPYLFVVARKDDGRVLWTRNDVSLGFSSQRWETWKEIPGCCLESEPAITVNSNRVMVASRFDRRFVFTGTGDAGTTWQGWKAVGENTFFGGPAIAWHGGGLQLAGRDSDGLIWVATANGATGATDGWRLIPGALLAEAGPAITANKSGTPGRIGVAARLSDKSMVFNLWE